MCSELQAGANFLETGLLHWVSSLTLSSQPSLFEQQAAKMGQKRSSCSCPIAGFNMDPLTTGTVAVGREEGFAKQPPHFSPAFAGRQQVQQIKQKILHCTKGIETGREREIPQSDRQRLWLSHSWQAAAWCGRGRQEACMMLRTELLWHREHLLRCILWWTTPKSFCLSSGTFGICRQRRKHFQLTAWKWKLQHWLSKQNELGRWRQPVFYYQLLWWSFLVLSA